MDDVLGISSSERVDLDVFLNKPAYFPFCFYESPRRCTDHQVISFTQDLFAVFCSVFVRIYLNITTDHFSEIMFDLSLADEKKFVKKIFTGASLSMYKFFDLNYLFFYEFFDLLSQVNGSDCFNICSEKSKYGPYCVPAVIVLIFVQTSLNMVHIVFQNVG